jgi:hypothetical protein
MEVYSLRNIFDNINNWLKFAEAKNAAIIAFIAVVSPTLIALYRSENEIIQLCAIISGFFFILSLLVSLLSFVPTLQIDSALQYSVKQNSSLMYFNGIISRSLDEYKQVCVKEFNLQPDNLIVNDLIEQIYYNALIARSKYVLFLLSVKFIIFGIFVPVLALLFLSLFNFLT